MLADQVHMPFGSGDGLGRVARDDGTCEARDSNPSCPYCLEESGERGGTKTAVVGGYEGCVFNVTDG